MNARLLLPALAPALALAVLTMAAPSRAAITSYSAELKAQDWRPGKVAPLTGNASIALNDTTNELSWAIHWAGSQARIAELTMHGSRADTDGDPLVLRLASGVSTQDLPGGALSGCVQLTAEQVEEWSAETWRVELRLWDQGLFRLAGTLELESLPPGLWL